MGRMGGLDVAQCFQTIDQGFVYEIGFGMNGRLSLVEPGIEFFGQGNGRSRFRAQLIVFLCRIGLQMIQLVCAIGSLNVFVLCGAQGA